MEGEIEILLDTDAAEGKNWNWLIVSAKIIFRDSYKLGSLIKSFGTRMVMTIITRCTLQPEEVQGANALMVTEPPPPPKPWMFMCGACGRKFSISWLEMCAHRALQAYTHARRTFLCERGHLVV